MPAIKSDVHSVWLVGTEVCGLYTTRSRYLLIAISVRTIAMRTTAIRTMASCYGYTYYGTEVWAIDQAATGSVQTYEVFSKCAAY